MSNTITEGKDRELPPDREGEIVRAPTPALVDLKAEISEAAAFKQAGQGEAMRSRSSIESRTDLRLAAINEAMRADPQRVVNTLAIEQETARRWADLDAGDFGRLRSAERRENALEAIAGHMRASPTYADELKKRSPGLADAAKTLSEERAKAKDVVDLPADQGIAAGRKAGPQATGERTQAGKELVAAIRSDIKRGFHRWELYDWDAEVTHRFATSEAAKAKAEELGVDRFRHRGPDDQVKQVDKIDGHWWVRGDLTPPQNSQQPPSAADKTVASVQEGVDRYALRSIEVRAEQRAAVGNGAEPDTDKLMAVADALAFRCIEDKDRQQSAAIRIAQNARQSPDYKAGLEKALPGEPGLAAKVYLLDSAAREKDGAAAEKALLTTAQREAEEAAKRALAEQHKESIDAAARSRAALIDAAALAAVASVRSRQTVQATEQIAKSSGTSTPPRPESQHARQGPPQDGRRAESDDPDVAAERTRAIKRPVSEAELSDALLRRFVVSHEKRGLLDKGTTEFTYRGGDQQGRVAFVDAGKALSTERDDRSTIRAMVEVATAKNWKEITVSGTDDFRRNAWLEARLAGMEVRGYEPREADKRILAEQLAQREQPINTMTADVEREPGRAESEKGRPPPTPDERVTFAGSHQKHIDGDALTMHEKTVLDASRAILNAKALGEQFTEATLRELEAKLRGERVYVGELVDHGPAPYKFDRDNGPSYYVTLKSKEGEQVVWGKELKEAMVDRSIGEKIVLQHVGKTDVIVKERVVDAEGHATIREKATQRNGWKAELLSRFSEKARAEADQAAKRPTVGVYDPKAPRPPAHDGAARGRAAQPERSADVPQRSPRER